jgi:zinc transporter ZupT
MILIISLLAVVALVVVHLFSGKLRFLEGTPRSVWLSIAGGVSVAYVFVHLLPELNEGQEVIAEAVGGSLAFVESHVYLVALLGLAVFYGVERAATSSRRHQRESGKGDSTSAGVALIGYLLLHRIATGLEALVLFSVAMALHFVVNDYGLRGHHKRLYTGIGRWLLAGAVLVGWAVALLTEIPEVALAVLIAFLAGGIVLNVLKEELPEERESRFWAFALGAAAYAAILLTL